MEQMNKDRIRQRAYQLWEASGRPDGKQEEHWQQALAEITAKDAYGLTPEGDTPDADTAEQTARKARRAR